jgi:hypothetical protein
MRSVTTAVSQTRIALLNYRLAQSQSQVAIRELALDLMHSIQYAARPPEFWVAGGYFQSTDHYSEVLEAAATIVNRDTEELAVETQDNYDDWAISLYTAHCTVLSWLGDLKDDWKFYATPDDTGKAVHFPLDFTFGQRNEQAIYEFNTEAPKSSTKGKEQFDGQAEMEETSAGTSKATA